MDDETRAALAEIKESQRQFKVSLAELSDRAEENFAHVREGIDGLDEELAAVRRELAERCGRLEEKILMLTNAVADVRRDLRAIRAAA